MEDPNDKRFEDFLKQKIPAAPARPTDEWVKILSKIENEKSWLQVFKDALNSKEFWVPVLSLAATAAIVLVVYTRLGANMNSDERINTTLNQISDLYSTDLDPSTSVADDNL